MAVIDMDIVARAVAASATPTPVYSDAYRNENFGPTLLAITCILVFFVVLTTALRVYTRAARRMLGLDDYTIIATCILCLVRMSIQIKQVELGNGKHRPFLTQYQYVTNNMLGWYTQVLLFASGALLKTSICLLIRRIKSSKKLDKLLWCVITGLILTNGSCIVVLIAQCNPVAKYWKGPTHPGHCWPTQVRIYTIYVCIAYNLLTDFFCSFLPLFVIWKLQIPIQKKIAVWSLMSLGLLATGFGVARAASLGLKTDDLSYTYAIAAVWSNMELFLGVIAANLALSRYIYLFFFNKGIPDSVNKSYTKDSQYRSKDEYSKFDSRTTVMAGTPREPSINSGKDSDIPLEPRIHKQTEVSWHVEKTGGH